MTLAVIADSDLSWAFGLAVIADSDLSWAFGLAVIEARRVGGGGKPQ
jgi:hypothetical protein